ncbi:BgTH12-00176 [Blumeria graminis f. sp. triticale]|uniref:Bgt-3325 n=3 Tax=Blumeria graminis TaxID=34373 RepID=A0A061HKX3_BLUGR|nr:hypothetical protein BGT96224_3325 [Blumeria graminis f. sp. tritici 96224]CAD6504670.1 BgTH12-00176 [Blumeria graminis f. sp. triticale]VDB92708.1 Bgt-3325 [Blumeria graminis f. sp. tritici]
MAIGNITGECPLYNSTFSLFRLSPLYIGDTTVHEKRHLRIHARRLLDILSGEASHNLNLGPMIGNDFTTRIGALQGVTWNTVSEIDFYGAEVESAPATHRDSPALTNTSIGMIITFSYEKAEYQAILLGNEGESRKNGFCHFPLLLLKMPGSLRQIFTEFLATTFDARTSCLLLSSRQLINRCEKYLSNISLDSIDEPLDTAERSEALRDIIKEVAIVIGFVLPERLTTLKTISFQIAREDVSRMISMKSKPGDAPFFEALADHLKAHMALNLWDEKVKIVKIACGAFVLSDEGRVKVTRPLGATVDTLQIRANKVLINGLMEIATGGILHRQKSKGS